MKQLKKRSECPISSALDIVGDKWSLLVIRDMIFEGKKTYNDFLASEEKIATNILANRLQSLTTAGIISRREHPENKSKILYEITPKGMDLLPLLLEYILWSDTHCEISPKAREFARIIRKDKAGVLKHWQNKITL